MATYEPHDKFFRKAREQGLPSRAAFKLAEILQRHRLVMRGARVLDLGCAPGGWLAILALAAGPEGKIVGIDLVRCKSAGRGVVTLVGDIRDRAARDAAREALGGAADLVTSDMAPKLSGIKARDEARCAELLEAALDTASESLRPGGAMVAKVFMSGEFHQTLARFEQRFARVETVRTKASRPGSAELYLVARGFKA